MKFSHSKLMQILKQFMDAESGETGDYPDLDEVLRKVVKHAKGFEAELREMLTRKNLVIHHPYDLIKEILRE